MSGTCQLCGLWVGNLTKHHLVPQNVSRTRKHPKSLKNDEGNFLWVCEECHSHVHALFSNQELRDLYSTRESLLASEQIGKYVRWRRKHPNFNGSSKMSDSRRH